MELAKPFAVVSPGLDAIAGTTDCIAHDVFRSMPVQDESVYRFLAVGRQEDLHVELDREVLNETRKLHEESRVDRVLEFVHEQNATANAGAEQSDLKHTPHAVSEGREVRRLFIGIVTHQKPVEPVGQLDVAKCRVDAFPNEVDNLPLRTGFQAFPVATRKRLGPVGGERVVSAERHSQCCP